MPCQHYLRLLIDGSSIVVCDSEYYSFNEEEILSLLDDEYSLLELNSFHQLEKDYDDEDDDYCFYDDDDYDTIEEQKVKTALYIANDNGIIYFAPGISMNIEKGKVYRFDIIDKIEYIIHNDRKYPVPQELKQYFDKLEIAN